MSEICNTSNKFSNPKCFSNLKLMNESFNIVYYKSNTTEKKEYNLKRNKSFDNIYRTNKTNQASTISIFHNSMWLLVIS